MTKAKALNFEVEGMTCPSCAVHVERALKKAPGVLEAKVPGWESGQAIVTTEGDVDPAALVTAVEQAGYQASLSTSADEKIELEVQGMTCDSCALHVEKALTSVTGVALAEIPGWQSGKATVTASQGVDEAALVTAVEKAGYQATVKTPDPKNDFPVASPTNGKGDSRFDLMVIGGGSAGFAAAIKGAELGYKVATLIRALEHYHQAGQHPFRGVHTLAGGLNWAQVVAHKDELVSDLRQAKYVDVLSNYPEVTYLPGYARLTGENGVEINGEHYAPAKIIITTGASPWAPPIPGLVEANGQPPVPYLTSTTAMELKELPSSMLVLGANAVGLEQAQIFARAGVYVTVVELLPRIAPFEDEEISAALQGYLEEEGLRIVTGYQTSKVEERAGRIFLHGEIEGEALTLDAEQLLVATGRRPNTAGIGLEEAGVQLGKRGEIIVDENLRSSNPYVFAAGDVTGRDMFVYVAAYAGGLAAENALTEASGKYDTTYIARVTFTDPQVASAGLTETQARAQGYAVKTSTLPMSYVPRALAARDTRGLVKLVADSATDRLLGTHILAPEAGEMIQVASLALKFGLTVEDLRTTIFPYLTNVEGLKLATLSFEKDVAMLSCCAG